MFNFLIRLSLAHRPLVLAAALVVLVLGAQALLRLPVEVLPDMTKPTVTLLTEAPGLAPEEVEALVTQPMEAAVQGVAGLDRLRSSSDVGLSLIFAEFPWGTDIHRARQSVQERLQSVLSSLPAGVKPSLTPISSLMGEVLLVGVSSKDGSHSPMELRLLADWTLRRCLQSIPGVSEVLTIGGGVQQLQVRPDLAKMAAFGISLEELEQAASSAAGNATSCYLQNGPREVMVRNLAMSTSLKEIGQTVVKVIEDHPVRLRDVAALDHGVQPMRGDASVNGMPGMILSVDKAAGFDTLQLTQSIEAALEEMRPTLPEDVQLDILFRQSDFISHAIHNLQEAIRDGSVMVAIVLFLFLLNARATLITLTAIPLSFATTVLVFERSGVSVNSMTLGGLAVAIGMVVDDAIVDVENVWRRLQEAPAGSSRLEVIATASGEVRSSILYATLLIVLVFTPLLALEGLEGRLFTPIATATITSMAASFLVSLTVIPVLCSFGFSRRPAETGHAADSHAVRALKFISRHTFLRLARTQPLLVLGLTGMAFIAAMMLYPSMGKEFLPAFHEGSATISLVGPPGSSLAWSNEIGEAGVRLLKSIPEVKSIGRRAGRAERDDHVMPVSVNEFDVEFHEGGRPRQEVFTEIRHLLSTLPGTYANVGQPIGHRLSHMLSGVSAKIAVKIFGPDLDTLRALGTRVATLSRSLPGMTDVLMEPQVPIPQMRVAVDREKAAAHGLQPTAINQQVSTLVGGKVLAELREGQRPIDLVLRLPESARDDAEKLRQLPLVTADGRRVPLGLIAEVREANGPNVIHRENTQRRLVVSMNTSVRDVTGLVQQLEERLKQDLKLPVGYRLSMEGEARAQAAAARRITLHSVLVFGIITLLLYGCFHSFRLAAMVLLNIPLALIGGLALTWWMIGTISIATLVGFIAVGGVAARNGIMMISHYLHLMRVEGQPFTWAMVERGTLERLVPVLMTALSAGIAVIPLVLAAGQPGKEILHPVAVVIAGGLVSSTLLDLLVTPAVFYHFGRQAALKSIQHTQP
ncbi:MAG: CusA/CzcA family heavy metal efflux RND transporter [Prosthecobacter sp.]|nr:CusA/CzcA family heavy metal efflux RND transporter [Prosthecobacter sp.]